MSSTLLLVHSRLKEPKRVFFRAPIIILAFTYSWCNVLQDFINLINVDVDTRNWIAWFQIVKV